jgi:hypothetical protein
MCNFVLSAASIPGCDFTYVDEQSLFIAGAVRTFFLARRPSLGFGRPETVSEAQNNSLYASYRACYFLGPQITYSCGPGSREQARRADHSFTMSAVQERLVRNFSPIAPAPAHSRLTSVKSVAALN